MFYKKIFLSLLCCAMISSNLKATNTDDEESSYLEEEKTRTALKLLAAGAIGGTAYWVGNNSYIQTLASIANLKKADIQVMSGLMGTLGIGAVVCNDSMSKSCSSWLWRIPAYGTLLAFLKTKSAQEMIKAIPGIGESLSNVESNVAEGLTVIAFAFLTKRRLDRFERWVLEKFPSEKELRTSSTQLNEK